MRNKKITQQCSIQEIVRWDTKEERIRMSEIRLARAVQDRELFKD